MELDEQRYLKMLQFVVENAALDHTSSFYFCYTYDLTRSLQINLTKKNKGNNQHVTLDEHFHWNQALTRNFVQLSSNNNNNKQVDSAVNQCTVPVIRGFVQIKNVTLNNGKSFKFALVSRLSHKRVGTRYFTRGIDQEGNAANYAETEQIVELENQQWLSFVQIRGSIPVHWSQKPCLKYQPKIKISEKKDSFKGLKKHFDELLGRYKSVTIVNLVKATGSENVLAEMFQKTTEQYSNKNVHYNHYDFHAKHKKLSHKMIEELVALVEKNIQSQGFFMYDAKKETVRSEQNGIVRVNCIDCLDRTNVAESVFASHVLLQQLRQLKGIDENESIKDHPLLDKVFKNTWADNGDVLSNLYAGTGALKADITRTGKRTLVGLYNDGSNSVTRYFLNNFSDGQKLDSINLFLGKYQVDVHVQSPFKDYKVLGDLAYILMFVWLFFIYLMWAVFGKNGRTYVNNPVLKNKSAITANPSSSKGTEKKNK